MLTIENLKADVDGKEIFKGFRFGNTAGKVHALMGPNGSGKSTFANVLMGKPSINLSSGKISLNGRDITNLSVTDRAKEGLFLAFQYPVEIPGVKISDFMRTSYNSVKKERLLPIKFKKILKEKMSLLEVPESFSERSLNEGFSGGEKKKAEILQLAILSPKYAVLDETDSGLDVTALKIVSDGVNKVRETNPDMGVVVITHYTRILRYLKPDFVHILIDGKIVKSGDASLAEFIEENGYKDFN